MPSSDGSTSGPGGIAGTGPGAGSGGRPTATSGGVGADGGRDVISIGRLDGPPFEEIDLAEVGVIGIDSMVDWAVPSLVLAVPGILIVLVVSAQVLGGVLWVPVVRRWLGGIGIRRREASPR